MNDANANLQRGTRNYKPNRTHQTYQSNHLDLNSSKASANPPSGLDNYLKSHSTTPSAANVQKNQSIVDA